jgi:hypothetical protein
MRLLLYTFGCSEPFVIIHHVFVNVHVLSSQSLTLLERLMSIRAHSYDDVKFLMTLINPLQSDPVCMINGIRDGISFLTMTVETIWRLLEEEEC